MSTDQSPQPKPVTLRRLRNMARDGQKFSALTCYDANTARWLESAGVHVLLVGDSAAQMVLGHESTIHAPLDLMIQLTAAVKRGAPGCLVMADMPFMSYQVSDEQAIRNAGRFLTEGLADLVKLEVDGSYGDLVGRLSRAGVPVVAHLGWLPQRKRLAGVRTAVIAGKTAGEARALVEQAELMEDRGAVMLLIEQCTAELAERIVQRVSIPVIGCGAGPACHGQVVVLQDLLGMTDWQPSFIKPLAQVGRSIHEAAGKWVKQVDSGQYTADHPYRMSAEEKRRFDHG
jgi:3-methyl-2-oxobutanoate hydroxymethyltransferase